MSIVLLETDAKYTDSPDAGHPKCLCSRCGKPIEEWQFPIRAWPDDYGYELRYHMACLGMVGDRTKEEWEAIDNEDFYDDYE